jgi:hypothetical protein
VKGWPNPNPSNANTSSTTEQQARIDDLWHAAVNGRGTYFSAKNPTSLALSLTTALTQIQRAFPGGRGNLDLEPTAGDNLIILPTYDAGGTGSCAHQIDPPSGPTYGSCCRPPSGPRGPGQRAKARLRQSHNQAVPPRPTTSSTHLNTQATTRGRTDRPALTGSTTEHVLHRLGEGRADGLSKVSP